MRLGRSSIGVGVAGAILSAWGCAAIIGADFDAHLVAVDSADTSPPAEAAPPPDVVVVDAGCHHALVPDKPSKPGTGGDIEFIVAIRSVDYGDQDSDGGAGYRRLGYDLDRACRGLEPVGCAVGKTAAPEGIDGIDNAAGGLIYGIKNSVPYLSNGVGSKTDTAGIEGGNFTIIYRVTGYNGMADDDNVGVEWFVAAPFGSDRDAGPEAGLPRPKWDGEDQWPLRADSVLDAGDGGFASAFGTKNAYVNNNVLVANVGQGRIFGGSVPFDLIQLILSGTIVPTKTSAGASTYMLKDGVIAGRWKADNVLASVPNFLIGNKSNLGLLCPGAPLYATVKAKVCESVDISSGLDLGATTPCDALSAGIGFGSWPVARPTKLVVIETSADLICPPTGKVDTCAGELPIEAGPPMDSGIKDAGKDG